MVEMVGEVDRDGRMRKLIEMGTRRRRRLRLMARVHMVVVSWLRILAGMRRRQVMMMGPGSTVRQQTVHGCQGTNGDTHRALLRDAISRNHSPLVLEQPVAAPKHRWRWQWRLLARAQRRASRPSRLPLRRGSLHDDEPLLRSPLEMTVRCPRNSTVGVYVMITRHAAKGCGFLRDHRRERDVYILYI